MRRTPAQLAGLVLGLVAFGLLLALDSPLRRYGEWGARPAAAAAVASLMAIWWLTEALPIYWTACVPIVLFLPLRIFAGGGAANVAATLRPYVDPYIFLFAGGMCVAAAMQQWGLHRRIALGIMRAIGTEPPRLLLGTLAATAFISLWISNTATAAMLLPIGMALIAQLETQAGRRLVHYGMAIMLAVAYGANVGGIGTKIGTAPNAQLAGFARSLGIDISFLDFLLVGLPFVVLFLPVVWLALWRVGRRDAPARALAAEVLDAELARLGVVRPAERIVLGVFAATAVVWILAPWIARRLGLPAPWVEGGAAMAAAAALALWRSDGRAVLELRSLRTVPWATLLLLGGGFALAAGVQGSGLSRWLADQLLVVRDIGLFGGVLLASLAAVGLSAVASNTATIAVLLVVLRDAAPPTALPAVLFAATIACSCDFALPAGTPPNAIVFGSGYVTIPRMARTGAVLDLAAALLAAVWCAWVVPRVL